MIHIIGTVVLFCEKYDQIKRLDWSDSSVDVISQNISVRAIECIMNEINHGA